MMGYEPEVLHALLMILVIVVVAYVVGRQSSGLFCLSGLFLAEEINGSDDRLLMFGVTMIVVVILSLLFADWGDRWR